MSIILDTERKDAKTRFITAVMYILLVARGLSMIYPFMLMISGAFKSEIDIYDNDIVPRFFYDRELLYKKFTAAKYNESLRTYLLCSKDDVFNFQTIKPPPMPSKKLMADWKEFCTGVQGIPDSYYHLGFFATLAVQQHKIVQKNERGFRNYMKELCKGDLDLFHREYAPTVENWFFMEMKDERLMDRTYQLGEEKLMDEFYKYKASRPYIEKIYLSLDGKYAKYIKLNPLYKGNIKIGICNGFFE